MRACLTILFTFLFYAVQAQNSSSISKVKSDLYSKLEKKVKTKSWHISRDNEIIRLTFIDTFFVNTAISPLRNWNGSLNKSDTLSVKIRFEDNWNQVKFDSIKMRNRAILEPLKNKFIAYYDSLQWSGIKLNKEMFLEKPYTYIKWWRGFNETEKKSIDQIIILPDQIINGVGVFVASDYRPPYMMIESEAANKRFFAGYDAFTDVLGEAALFKYEENY